MVRVSIIGLGLIGGSIGLALKQAKHSDVKVTGFARKQATARRARERGAVDTATTDPATAVADADVVFICTPPSAIPDIFRSIAGPLPPKCIVTDTASTKVQVMAWAKQLLPAGTQFIGGHPMAGKETTGIDVAEAGLFRGCTYCLVPAEGASEASLRLVKGLAEAMGARPLLLQAREHDNLVAGVSHLPTLVSAALFATASGDAAWPLMSRLAASGFRDVTRLASSDHKMNRDICATNRDAIVQWIDRFIVELTRLRDLIKENDVEMDGALEQVFQQVRQARQRWMEQRYPSQGKPQ